MKSPITQHIEYYPENVLKFCPRCGSAAFTKQNEDYSFKCSNCKFRYYINSASAVAGLIVNQSGQLLLTIRKNDPGKGSYDLPGGFINPGEKAEAAILREIKEELNLEISSIEFFGTYPNKYLYGGIVYFTTDITFICHVNSFESLNPDDDVAGFEFIHPKEIDLNKVGLDSVRNIIWDFLKL